MNRSWRDAVDRNAVEQVIKKTSLIKKRVAVIVQPGFLKK